MRYYLQTLGCPKNQVDSDKLEGKLQCDGYEATTQIEDADLVVVNTCAFIEAARQESIETVLDLADQKSDQAELVVTGCLAERYGDELAKHLPEVSRVAGFGAPLTLSPTRRSGSGLAKDSARIDLLHLPRPKVTAPWAYVKVAEGCDRKCGFCAIPSFRGPQRSRPVGDILEEVDALDVREVVLIAQDLASYGNDLGQRRALIPLVREIAQRVPRVRLLYLYPSDLTDELAETLCEIDLPYFDLSLQHVSGPLLRRMRRWGDGKRFAERIRYIRKLRPDAAFRTNFIVGYPGETEEDHDQLLRFVEEQQIEWASFFAFCKEEGTYAADLDQEVSPKLRDERLAELQELQDRITTEIRSSLIGQELSVLIDAPGRGRSHREAPEIDGIIRVPRNLPVGDLFTVEITSAEGPDLEGSVVKTHVATETR